MWKIVYTKLLKNKSLIQCSTVNFPNIFFLFLEFFFSPSLHFALLSLFFLFACFCCTKKSFSSSNKHENNIAFTERCKRKFSLFLRLCKKRNVNENEEESTKVKKGLKSQYIFPVFVFLSLFCFH